MRRTTMCLAAGLVFEAACSMPGNDYSSGPGAPDGAAGGSGGTVSACVPGAQVECTCLGGAVGVQTCNQSGSGYARCECPDASIGGAGGNGGASGGGAAGIAGASGDAGGHAGSPDGAGGGGTSGCRYGSGDLSSMCLLPNSNYFNTPVDTLPVDSHSAKWIETDFNGEFRWYADQPYNVVRSSTLTPQYLSHIDLQSVSDNIQYPIPASPKLHPSDYDQVLQIYDIDTNFYYNMYHAVRETDGSWTASVANYYDMSSNTLRTNIGRPPEGEMQVKYDEVAAGEVRHAIQVVLAHTDDSYVWPYFRSNGEPYNDLTYPPVGQRFRLKSSVDISGLPTQARVIAQALKTYGMVVTDQHGSEIHVQIIGNADDRWDSSLWDDLNSLNPKDFEAVDCSSWMLSDDSMQVRGSQD
jgi:hypothetical protein